MRLDSATVIDGIRASAARFPLKVALRTPSEVVTFGELIARVDALGQALRHRGIGPGTRVGIHLQRAPELIVGMLSVLAAGGAYVPLDPDYPRARLRYIVEDSQISLLLGQEDAADLLAGMTCPRMDPAEWAALSAGEPLGSPEPHDPAYLIYTSGSTGNPKGVVIEHQALMNYLGWGMQALPSTGGGVPLFASVSFDHAVTCIYLPLLAGEPLTLLPPIEGGRALARNLLTGHRYSFVKITPSHLRLLDAEQCAELGCSADMVMLGGERASWELVDRLRRDNPGLSIMNHYGPTEATVGCCTYTVGADVEVATGTLPIGRPIPGIRVAVRDSSQCVCSVDEPGELFIGGVGLAREYWRQPELTATSFLILPDSDGTPTRWYSSGDMVVRRADGVLEYLGRVDDQIKILGHRIEPAEIERVIRSYPGVDDAAVVAIHHTEADELLAAVASKEPGVSEASLRSYIRHHLPAAMVPARMLVLDQLPVTANGKLDRDAILGKASVEGKDGPGELPQSSYSHDIEGRVAAKWQEVLGVAPIGLDADFFDLGGDSLANVEIVEWVSQAFGVELELAALFQHPTVREISHAIRSLQDAGRLTSP
jgi:amino acid adenylation domain-containing protein